MIQIKLSKIDLSKIKDFLKNVKNKKKQILSNFKKRKQQQLTLQINSIMTRINKLQKSPLSLQKLQY